MDRRQFIKAACAVPVVIASGAVVARDALHGRSIAEMVWPQAQQMTAWQREFIDHILMTNSKRYIVSWPRERMRVKKDEKGRG